MSEVPMATMELVEGEPPAVLGIATLTKIAFQGIPLDTLCDTMVERLRTDPNDSAALFDLSMMSQLSGLRDEGVGLLFEALQRERLFRRPPPIEEQGLRLLAFMAPGDLMANTPVDFLLEGSNVTLDMLFLWPGAPMPDLLPDHDVAIVAIGESDQNCPLLGELAPLLRSWPRPVVNGRAERISALARDSAAALLAGIPGCVVPETRRVPRGELEAVATGESPPAFPPFPVILRPVASHAGKDLQKIGDAAALRTYLDGMADAEFYMTPFIDYRSSDGLFRKYRVAFIDGIPYASHLAISGHWMVHYLNAGMSESAEKRAEEARFMVEFDQEDGFAARHAAAFRAMVERIGLDYFIIDCGETPEGGLLLFETDVAMIVHSIDSPELFPYKIPAMVKLFQAFHALLAKRATAI